jgi:signal transduction histidine kinase
VEEVIGRPVSEILGEDFFQEVVRPHLEKAFSGQTVRYQQQIDFRGVGRRTMDITYFPFYDDTGEISALVLNSRDITETRQLEEKLMQSQKMESIGTLAGGVAHEINNPINGIMNYAQLIIDRTEKENPAKELAEEIIHETKRVARIVRNLLTFARHEKQSHSPAQLSDVVASVLSLIQAVMRHDQIDLHIDIPDDLPSVKCRSQQIQQVLMNLMTNSRDALNQKYPSYSPEKQLRISVRLIVRNDRRFVRTTVEDFGTGITPDVRDRMFDPFFTTKPKETGTGLGLSITYGIVKEHRGELTVESEPGQYTRIHMDLPVDNGWELPWSEEH